MSAEENKDLVRHYYDELWNKGNVAIIDALTTSDYAYHLAGSPAPLDHTGLRQYESTLRAAFPDWHATVEDMLAEGDKVAVHWTGGGTHQGTFQGIPATGKQVTAPGMTILRIVDGKIAEERVVADTLGALQQVGAIPLPGQT